MAMENLLAIVYQNTFFCIFNVINFAPDTLILHLHLSIAFRLINEVMYILFVLIRVLLDVAAWNTCWR